MNAILDQEVRTKGIKQLGCALETKSKGFMRRLLLKGADVDTPFCHVWDYSLSHDCWLDNSYTATPLTSTPYRSDVKMVELLLHFGANVHALSNYRIHEGYRMNIRSATPLLFAAYLGNRRIAELLIVCQRARTLLQVVIKSRILRC